MINSSNVSGRAGNDVRMQPGDGVLGGQRRAFLPGGQLRGMLTRQHQTPVDLTEV